MSISKKLRDLQSRVLKLNTEQKAAFNAAVLMGRGFTPSRILDATEWAALWGIHSTVNRRFRNEIEDLTEEIIPLSSADCVIVTGPKNDSWVLSLFKKTLAVAGIIALAVSLVIAIWFGVSTVMNSVALNGLASTDAKIIDKIDENQKVLKGEIDKNTEDIKGIKSDIETIKSDVKKIDGKADDASAKASSAAKNSNTGSSGNNTPSKQTVDNTKLIQTLVGTESDGVIGDSTKKAVEDAAKVLAQKETPAPSSPTTTPEPSATPKPIAPTVSTGGTSHLDDNSVDIKGTVNPNGLYTEYWVEYGTSSDNLKSTTHRSAGSLKEEKSVTIELVDLSPGTVYNYRVVASNSVDIRKGDLRSFKTDGSSTPTPGPSSFTTDDINIEVTVSNGYLKITSSPASGKTFPEGTKYGVYLNGSFYSQHGWVPWNNAGNSIKFEYPGGTVQVRISIELPGGGTVDSRTCQYPQ